MDQAPESAAGVYDPGQATIGEDTARRLLAARAWEDARFFRPATDTEAAARRDAELYDEEMA